MENRPALQVLSDDALLCRIAELVHRSRTTEAEIVAHIAEVDARRLYAREACSSMFMYCIEVLHFSEAEAYLRITAARASREHPVLLSMLAEGRLHLSAIERLAPHLTPENCDRVLARAAHRTKRQVEELVAELAPRPDAPALVRRLPVRASVAVTPRLAAAPAAAGVGDSCARTTAATNHGGASTEPAPTALAGLRSDEVAVRPAARKPRAVLEPTAPGRYKVQFTADVDLRDKLERLRALMRHAVPDGDLGAIIEQAVSEKLERLEAARFARVKRPRTAAPEKTAAVATPASRRIPAAIRRAVHARDGGRCRYTDGQGRRCTSRRDLEFHHRYPFGHGGGHSVANLILLCSTHNRLIGEADYGRARPADAPDRPTHPTG